MKKLVITAGDPAGCGPAITLDAINKLKNVRANFIVVGDKKILSHHPLYKAIRKRITLVDVATPAIEKIRKGQPSKVSGRASLLYLSEALHIMQQQGIKRLVTAPISKEAVQFLIPQFSGHTEYLTDYFKVKNFAMMLTSSKLKVILLSRHIPLRKVSQSFAKKYLINVFSLVEDCLKKSFGIRKPKIAIASVNPHAGIDTFLWKEEKVMVSAINDFSKKVFGPYPADTLFTKDNLRKYDCLLCAYHDQAMIPFKLLSFREGVNLTLGLPIIRTSPAHGVAYDLVKRKGVPFSSSMVEAIKLALKLRI